MKKVLFAGFAFAAMALASCSNEDFSAPVAGDGTVVFTAELPVLGSRAYGDGLTATNLTAYVYSAEAGETEKYLFDKTATFDNLHATVELALVTGKTYKVVFWAQADGAPYSYDTTDQTITVTYGGAANDESRDAFFVTTDAFKVSGPVQQTVQLKRPFAQLNVLTSDYAEALASGVEVKQTGLTMELPSVLNLADGKVDELAEVTFNLSDLPTGTASVGDKTYTYLSMNYILAAADKAVADVKVATDFALNAELSFTAVPLQRNYRTNIYGALLTNPAVFDVEILPGFDDQHNKEIIPAATASDFVTALAAVQDGGTITVTDDIDLTETPDIIIDKAVTIDVPEGKVMKVMRQTPTRAAEITKVASITVLDGATLTISGEGLITGDSRIVDVETGGSLFVEGVTLKTSDRTRGSAITVNPGASAVFNAGFIDAAFCTVWVEGEFTLNGGKLRSTSSNLDGAWSYALRAISETANIVINGGEVEGVQGAVGAYSGNIEINGGYFHTHPIDGKNVNFYALYVADGMGTAVVNGGDFYSEGRADVYLVNNHGSISLRGGRYEDQGLEVCGNDAEGAVVEGTMQPAEGFEWVAVEGNDVFKWTIRPVAE